MAKRKSKKTARRGSSRSVKPKKSAPVKEAWESVLKQIPGYDPFATAGDCRLDVKKAKDACDFYPECLKFIEGERADTPFELEKWQQAITGNIFGWLRPDGTRRYREVFIYVPRKNGKTPWLAGLVCLVAFVDAEPGGQLYSAAADREQAALIYRHAAGMIAREPLMASRSKIYRTFKSIEFPDTDTIYKALSSESETKHGLNIHLAAIDELHAHPNGDLVDVLTTGTASRRQPLIIYITTADFQRESVCNQKYDYACKVRDGIIYDPYFLPVIYEAGRDDDWTDEKVWAKANPNLGVSVSVDYLRRECQRAQDSPTYENTFKRLHLNIITEQDVRWLAMDKWDACGESFDAATLAGQPCWAGLDLSSTTDITALQLFFPESGKVLPYFWIPSDNAREREKRDRVPYATWARQGLIETTEGNVVDYDRIRERISQIGKEYNILGIAIDRWNSTQLQTQLAGDGFNVVQFGQGFASMTAPSKELEKRVMSADLNHGGHPVLRWMASNVSAEMDAAGNIKPSKKKSTEKIDGIVALVMAIGLSLIQQDTSSVYETRGVLSV